MKRTILIAIMIILATPLIANARARHHRPAPSTPTICAGCEIVPIANGQKIVCDSRFCSKFQALIADLCSRHHCPRDVKCFARGHRYGSNHDGGGACDIDQRARNRTAGFMYHSTSLIVSHGLHDGCSFRDCGHVEAISGLCNYGQCRTRTARRYAKEKPVKVTMSQQATW